MSFFDSDIVLREMQEINELQEIAFDSVLNNPIIKHTKKEQLDFVNIVLRLVEKQRIFYTRLKLTEDPRAIEYRCELEERSINFYKIFTGKEVSVGAVDTMMSELEEKLLDLKKLIEKYP